MANGQDQAMANVIEGNIYSDESKTFFGFKSGNGNATISMHLLIKDSNQITQYIKSIAGGEKYGDVLINITLSSDTRLKILSFYIPYTYFRKLSIRASDLLGYSTLTSEPQFETRLHDVKFDGRNSKHFARL
jgi:hypothetical protein